MRTSKKSTISSIKCNKKIENIDSILVLIFSCGWCRGFNIGQRLIDEFLARSGSGKCNRELKEIAEIIAKVFNKASIRTAVSLLIMYITGGFSDVSECERHSGELECR